MEQSSRDDDNNDDVTGRTHNFGPQLHRFFFFQHGFWVPLSLCWGHCLMQLTFIGSNTAISLKHLPFDLPLLLYGSKTMISFKTPNISITEKQNCNGKWVCFLLEYRKILK